MTPFNYRWYAQKVFQTQGIELLLVNEENGHRAYGLPTDFIIKTEESAAAIIDPTLKLTEGVAQSLLQALWDVGLRPNNGEGTSAQVEGMKKHIAFAERVADVAMETNRDLILSEQSSDTFDTLRTSIVERDLRVAKLEAQLHNVGILPVRE